MGDRLKFERFLWFHERVRANRYPNARRLAEQFELSQRTAQRDIEFMCERLNAPLEYSRERKGYFYTDESYELPPLWFSEDNIMALAIAVRLASSVPDATIKRKLHDLIDKVLSVHSGEGVSLQGVTEKVSVKNIEYSRVDEERFHEMVESLLRSKPVTIKYYSPHNSTETVRTIFPLHLIHYMGSWHIVAYCTTREGLRDFALSRIRSVQAASGRIALPEELPSVKEYTRKHFGIMQGGETREVCLKFSPRVAEWVCEQVWHPRQEAAVTGDGGLLLKFPVADLREVRRRILSYGSEVLVIEPEELREELKKEITNMGRAYKVYDTG